MVAFDLLETLVSAIQVVEDKTRLVLCAFETAFGETPLVCGGGEVRVNVRQLVERHLGFVDDSRENYLVEQVRVSVADALLHLRLVEQFVLADCLCLLRHQVVVFVGVSRNTLLLIQHF
jgi:hypothetical protein